MKNKTGIYALINPTGEIYIGQSRDMRSRLYNHKRTNCTDQSKLYQSLKQYGFANHEVKMLSELPIDVSNEVLYNYEILFIEAYKDAGFMLLNSRGGGIDGKLSETAKQKMSNTRKSLPLTEKQLRARKENGAKVGKLQRTEKQNEVGRENFRRGREKIHQIRKLKRYAVNA